MSSMSAATKETSQGSSQTSHRDIGAGSKVKKKDHAPQVTLPPLCPQSSCLTASAAKPLSSCTPCFKNVPSDTLLSLLELPETGTKRAIAETKWKEELRLMAAALGAAVPTRATQQKAESTEEKDEPVNVPARKKITKDAKVAKPETFPHTGTDVVQMFTQKQDPKKSERFYLKPVKGDTYRPYDLQVVQYEEAGPEHYIFSSSTVVHTTKTGVDGVVSLTEWYREYKLWTALQKIPFFRNFRVQRAFTRWYKYTKNMHIVRFQRKRQILQDILLVAVPRFRNALHLFTRVTEELKETHVMYLDDSKTYTLLEFKNVLTRKNEECLLKLETLSEHHAVILNTVREESYREHKELQIHLKLSKRQTGRSEPIHRILAHRRQLKEELFQSGSILQKLGSFAALIHQMIVQSLVTITQKDGYSFLNLLKRATSRQCCLFSTDLCFSSNSQLTVEPPVHEFFKTMSEQTAVSTIIQKCENLGFFLEISNNVCKSDQDLTSDGCVNYPGENNDEMNDLSLKDMSDHQLVQSEATSLKVQSSMVHGCYYPLSKTKLEWHINIGDVTKQAETEQAKIMQDTELELQQVYRSHAWLTDIHLFVVQWSAASLESMKGQPAALYEEDIKKLHSWAQRVDTVESFICTANQLFIISCTHAKEALRQQLCVIEEQILEQLVEEVKANSECFISDLVKTSDELKTEPQDVHDFSVYVLRVRESVKMLADRRKRLEYILSLHNTICINYMKMTEQELTLKEKMLGLWDYFISVLKQAENRVCHSLPSMINALDSMVSFLACDLKNIVFEAASGSFIDPSQNTNEMVSKLCHMCTRMQSLKTKLEELNRCSQNMQEHPLDLTTLTTDVGKVTARKELWRLKAAFTAWLEEWKQLQLSEVMISQAQEKIAKWKEQTHNLTNIISSNDAVLEGISGILDSLSLQVEVMAKLTSKTLKDNHKTAIFQGLGLLYVPGKTFTAAEVMSQQPEMHQKLTDKVCRDAQTEWNAEQSFQKLSLGWKDRFFQMNEVILPVCQNCETQNGLLKENESTESTLSNVQTASPCSCNDARFIIIGLETLVAEIDNDLITLSILLKSPVSVEFRLQLDDCVQSLQELATLLDLFERHQEMWAFLTKTFRETSFYDQGGALLRRFQPVDETFKELMSSVSADPHVLNFVFTETNDRFHGSGLCQTLRDGLSTMQAISNQMEELLCSFRDQFSRLWFLSDREVMQLLSYHPLPFTLHNFLHKCFKGVCWLEVDFEIPSGKSNVLSCKPSSENHKQMKVLGFFGSLQEHISFHPPLETNPDTLSWLCVFEKQLKSTMIKLTKQCALLRNHNESSSQDLACDDTNRDTQPCSPDMIEDPQPVLDLLSDYPLQCLLVVEEAVWCDVVLQAFQEKDLVQLNKIKKCCSSKLKILGDIISKAVMGSKSESLVSKYTMMCLRTLVQLTMNHTQQLSLLMKVPCVLEKSFEWQSLIKYHINPEDQSMQDVGNSVCYVDVLGHQFQYGFEYYGPEDLMMVHTPSTDKAIQGLVLALTRYRSGFVSGPSMSGKTNTVVQLGKALGQLFVLKQCYPNMTSGFVQQMLLGALQTGAWFLLESVDLLRQNVLSSLGQLLEDIHQFFRSQNQKLNDEPNNKQDETFTGCRNISNPECQTVFLGKTISPMSSYGCVLISSKAPKIPESLRFATRPVALTHPDYRIIVEVTLASIGFSEATSLSFRLVSLISLAKDSNCLADVFTDNQSCFLVILQKIISASEIYLQHAAIQLEIPNETKVSANAYTELLPSQNMPAKPFEKDKNETAKLPKLCISHQSVIQSLMEEKAIVKAVISVLIPEHKKTSQFYMIFKDTFPIVCQFPFFQEYIEETEKNQLQDALTEELQQMHLYSDMEIISKALTLYQALNSSPGVILIGPSGSGKSTCYKALAAALNRLASCKEKTSSENENMTKRETSHADLPTSVSNWCSVQSLVLFPNTMSHDELFGCFCEKGWEDGPVAKVLRDLERQHTTYNIRGKTDEALKIKWLVMDGEPVGQPSWLDYLTTLFSTQDPYLCLLSGETLFSSPHLSLLMEMTDLHDASPSAVTRCSLVYFTSTNLWKAIWKSEMDALLFEHKLDQEVLKLWNNLANDLFSPTLSLLVQNNLTSVNNFERGSCNSYGLQEIMSFFRILRALLHHFVNQLKKYKTSQTEKIDGNDDAGINAQNKLDLLIRNMFLVSYCWGFGAHLHSRHWEEFDLLARQVLFSSRYKILVPDEESVFDHFFGMDRKMCPNKAQLTTSIFPKVKKLQNIFTQFGTYRQLLTLMLEANQPVLIAGEPGSGKTTICSSSLSFERPHITLPASPLLSSRHLHIILNSIRFQKNQKTNVSSIRKQRGLLIFIDDLHEVPCDVFGKVSTALETLRQSISKGEILTFDTYFFKSLSSQTVSYLTTSCSSALGDPCRDVISLRLSYLFSIFVLPSLSTEVILSIHSPWMKDWLNQMPLNHSSEKMANCVITATKSLFDAVCAQFQPSAERPHLIFSRHDIQKVFSGMYLWHHGTSNPMFTQKNENIPSPSFISQSGLTASDLKIVHLWMHECMHTLSDRLCLEDERKTFISLLVKTAAAHYGCDLVDENHPGSLEDENFASLPGEAECTSVDQHFDTTQLQQAAIAGHSNFKNGHAQTESKTVSSEETDLKPYSVQPQLINHLEDIMKSLVYGPEFSDTLKFSNQRPSFQSQCLYQVQDFDVLQQELFTLMNKEKKDEKNNADSAYNTTTGYIVHRHGVSQLLHILRALLIPGGHGVLIGSGRKTGRKTAVRLAAYLTGCQLLEIHSGNESKLHEILKEAGKQTSVDGVNVIILVHEEVSLPVREELLLAMAQKVFPGLHREDELRNLVCKVTAVKRTTRSMMESWITEKSLSQAHKNIHVFLLMPVIMTDNSKIPDNKKAQTWIAQMFKAVRLSCCVEVYQTWSKQSLMEAAIQCLQICSSENESLHLMPKESSEDPVTVALAGIHQSACCYASVFLKAQLFSPRTYVEFISYFVYLCSKLQGEWRNKNKRVAAALARLEIQNNTTMQYKENLMKLQEKTQKKKQLEKELYIVLEDQKIMLETASEKCEVAANELKHLEELIREAQEQTKPVFMLGLKLIQCLNPSDLKEVRNYRNPPDSVVKIMDAICLLFNYPPGWESAKQLIGQPNFFQEMEFFDSSSLTHEQLQQLEQIVHSPQFVPESVRETSKACESLCRWVQAVYEFCSVKHQLLVMPQMEVKASEAQSQLKLAKQHRKEVDQQLEDTELKLRFLQKELDELMIQLYTAEVQEEEATACDAQLDMHVQNWKAAFQESELLCQCIPGDALLLAAVISYLGPFEPDLRTDLLSKWKELCQTGSIDVNPKDLRTSLFTHTDIESVLPSPGFPIPVTERLQLPLSQLIGMDEWQLEDSLSARLVVKLLLWGYKGARMERWPLLTDTEQFLENSPQYWLPTGEKTKVDEEIGVKLVVCADDSQLLDKLDHAAKKGWKILVTHLERAEPSPEFLSRLTRPDGCWFSGLQQPSQPNHPDFCLFLSTDLPVQLLSREIHPSILAQVLVVDLSLSSDEIQEVMLTQLLQSDCRKLLIQHKRYQNYNQFLQKKLVSEEDALMDYIQQSDTVLQKDTYFLLGMAVCEEEMKELQAEIKLLSEELEHQESLLAAPRQLAKLAAALYQALQAVARLSPAYYFSLHDFIKVIQEAFSINCRSLVLFTTGKAADNMFPETVNTIVIQLLVQYRPRLFKRHFAVLKLLVCLAVLEHNQLCSEAEKLVFLRGLKDIEHSVTEVKTPTSSKAFSNSSTHLPSWIPPHVYSELLILEKIPSFRGLHASICTSPTQWQEYLDLTSSTVTGAVPCGSHANLSLLQRALLWKTILPHSLEKVADAIAACLLCLSEQSAGFCHAGNPKALLRYLAKHEGPITLVLPNPEGDESINIQPLHLINQLAHSVEEINKVQVKVIPFGVRCDSGMILPMLDKALCDGHWLVFNNCHLLDHWDSNVVARLNQLICSFKEETCMVHPHFRLWFVTQENASNPLPASVQMCALPLVCDSPWDLKEELSCSLQQVVSVSQTQSLSHLPDDNMKLLLRSAIFHSVLLQRQTYTFLGFGRIYHWSQEDLLALVDAHICIASLCHDKTKALQYISVNLIHGGHVMDSADSEVVESLAKTCFITNVRKSSVSGSGPHILSNITNNCGHSDLTGLLQELEKLFQDSAVSDTAVLGLGVDVASEIGKINSLDLNRQLQASQTPSGVRCLSTEQNQLVKLPACGHARERLQALQSYLTHKKDSSIRTMGTVSCSALHDFLRAEWDDLIDLVSSLLSQLQQPVQNMSFASLMNFTDVSRLERRAELISSYLWHHKTSEPHDAYRLSAFRNPRGFLVALMREAAKQNYKYTSDVILHFQVLCNNTYPALLPPDSVYLSGLELRGASWDTELEALQDTFSPQPFLMPLISVKARVRSADTVTDSLSCKSSYLLDSGNLQAAVVSPQTATQLSVYHCPLYLDKEHESGNSALTDENIVTKVPLYTKLHPVLCSLRRVRLVSTL